MKREELLFDWRDAESRFRDKFMALLIVSALFAFFFWLFKVKLETPSSFVGDPVSVLYLADNDLGRIWRLRAEEGGPFPGRLEAMDEKDLLEKIASYDGMGVKEYQPTLVPFVDHSPVDPVLLLQKGRRYYPDRTALHVAEDEQVVEEPIAMQRKPVLLPYESESLEWLPDELNFELELAEGAYSASWRFLLELRTDGSVAQCVALSGADRESTDALTGWFYGLRFQPSEEERWLGLRVEFVNE